MEIITAAASYDVDLRAPRTAEFRPIAVPQDLEFFNGIDGGINQDGALRPDIIIVRPIYAPLVGVGWRAAEGNIHTGEKPFVLGVEVLGDRDAWHHRGQLYKVAAVQRQLTHLFSGNEVAHHARLRFDLHRGGLHFHGFHHAAHGHFDGDVGKVSDVRFDAFLFYLFKALFRDGDVVYAGRELREAEASLGVGRGGTHRSRLRRRDGHAGAGDSRATGVGHHADNRSRSGLCNSRGNKRKQGDNQRRKYEVSQIAHGQPSPED